MTGSGSGTFGTIAVNTWTITLKWRFKAALKMLLFKHWLRFLPICDAHPLKFQSGQKWIKDSIESFTPIGLQLIKSKCMKPYLARASNYKNFNTTCILNSSDVLPSFILTVSAKWRQPYAGVQDGVRLLECLMHSVVGWLSVR